MSKRHPGMPSPTEVARFTRGRISFVLKDLPPADVMKKGYETLRRTVIWASRETERPIPKEVQTALRWMRDTWVSGTGFVNADTPEDLTEPEATS